MGTPLLTSMRATAFFICLRRNWFTSSDVEGPSQPQFQL